MTASATRAASGCGGHASASARYGVPARDIGFGLYLIYPVFYNDVTSAWRLPRRQRVVIDLAGTFFQFLVGAVYALVGRVTGQDVFELTAVTVFSMRTSSCSRRRPSRCCA